jgi:hypothetical protein
MQDFGRGIIIFGIILILLGSLLTAFERLPFIGKLPGDILIKRDNFTFYAPIVTGIIISIILSIIFTIVSNLRR